MALGLLFLESKFINFQQRPSILQLVCCFEMTPGHRNTSRRFFDCSKPLSVSFKTNIKAVYLYI